MEGFVKGLDSVGSEEHDPIVLLQQSQEDAYHCIPLDVVVSPFLEEYVSFIEQDDCVPVAGDLQDVPKFVLKFVNRCPQFPDCHTLEGFLQEFTDRLSCKRLACAWWAVEQEDAPAPFPADNIFEAAPVVLDQTFYEFLAVL